MRLLLDTHALYWALIGSPHLSQKAIALLEDGANQVLFSPVSCYELEWKSVLGKIEPMPRLVAELALSQGFAELPITAQHATAAALLPAIHRDPWDRLLAAQAKIEHAPLLSADSHIAKLGAPIIW
ncbi:MAG: type II toxin-antitoxin system VapC family toxin [Caulobacterales bacterium]|jgi:PIN domain nuclease of toxin-antitoxin system